MPTRGANLDALADMNGGRFVTSGKTLRRAGASLALCAALVVCWRAAEVRPLALFDADALASVWAFVRGLFPPDLSPDFLRTVFTAAAQTLAIAVTGTMLSIVIGVPLGVLSTATLYRRGVLLAGEPPGAPRRLLAGASRFTRALLGFLRAVPDLVWGLLFVVAVGLGALAGALALAFSYAGVLGRVYADVFEDVDPRPLEALYATGATRAQVFLRAVWPQAAPSALAYTLYSFECCLRAASVLGFVGAGGIGYEINLSMRLFEYGQVLTLILTLIALLAMTDALSRLLRRRLHAQVSSARLRNMPASPATLEIERPRLPLFGGRRGSAFALTALSAVAVSFYASGFASGALFDGNVLPRIARFAGALLPPDLDPAFLRSLGVPLLQTLGISVVGTLIGIAVGALLALPATSTLMLAERDAAGRRSAFERAGRWSSYVGARLVTGALRSVPELVWVLICILAVGLGPFAGTLAVGLHTGGVLAKLYAETLEEVPERPVEALRASGANALQVLIWGVWPQARPTLISYTVLRWEMNLRVSTVLGLVGGGGLGQAIHNNVQLGFYPRVATLVIVIYGLVLATDWLGDRLRTRPAQG